MQVLSFTQTVCGCCIVFFSEILFENRPQWRDVIGVSRYDDA